MFGLKIAGTDQVSFEPVPILMVVKIIWSTGQYIQLSNLSHRREAKTLVSLHTRTVMPTTIVEAEYGRWICQYVRLNETFVQS